MTAEAGPGRPAFGTFLTIWGGQVVSTLGSGMTAFALGVWVYQRTGSATLFAWIAAAATLPAIVLSPLVGALVDRHDRRRMMIVGDTGAAVATVTLLALLVTDSLAVWHVYPIAAVAATFNAFQYPAFSAATTLLVDRRQLGRAAGLGQVGESAAQILAPLLAGLVVVALGLAGVVVFDLATFAVAVVTLLLVRVPAPPPAEEDRRPRPSLLREAILGWTFIRERPGLLALLAWFALLNFAVPLGMVLATPLVLSFTDAARLGVVLAVASAGALAGGVLMSAWGGPRKRIRAILGSGPLVAAGFLLAGLRPSVTMIAAGLFLVLLAMPVVGASSQAIWQSKVPPALQGRVFAVRRMAAQITGPVAFFVAGPLADRVFQPLLAPGGSLAEPLGPLFGTGAGRGIGLLYAVVGVVFLAVTAAAATFPRLVRLEDDLPDALPATPTPPAAPAVAPGATPGVAPAAGEVAG